MGDCQDKFDLPLLGLFADRLPSTTGRLPAIRESDPGLGPERLHSSRVKEAIFMRNLLALVGALVVTVLGVGWYLDWFRVHRAPSEGGKSNYNVEFNTNKINGDLQKGGEKLQSAIEKKLADKKEESPPNPFNLTSRPAPKQNAEEGPDLDPPTFLPPPSIPQPPR
jgi:hypothetical protein